MTWISSTLTILIQGSKKQLARPRSRGGVKKDWNTDPKSLPPSMWKIPYPFIRCLQDKINVQFLVSAPILLSLNVQ